METDEFSYTDWTPLYNYDIYEILSQNNSDAKICWEDKTKRRFHCLFKVGDPSRGWIEPNLFVSNQKQFLLKQGETEVGFQLRSNETGKLSHFAFEVSATNPYELIEKVFEVFFPIVSYWSFKFGCGIHYNEIIIRDGKNDVDFKLNPESIEKFRTTQTIDPTVIAETFKNFPSSHLSLISLYREGRNSISPYYRFLCFYKVLEALLKNGLTKETTVKIKQISSDVNRKSDRITIDHLKKARAHFALQHFDGMKFTRFLQETAKDRNRIAHGMIDSEIFEFDNFGNYVRFTLLANITDLIAREVIAEEIQLLNLLNSASTSNV